MDYLKDKTKSVRHKPDVKDLPDTDPIKLLRPETELEFELLQHPSFLKGLQWGIPRFGHPEGKVLLHIREVLDNIDHLQFNTKVRQQLRTIAFAHDTFKYKEEKGNPRDWSKHHGALARKFMEKFIDQNDLLDIIELHDEAYHVWCLEFYHKLPGAASQRLDGLLDRIEPILPLYHDFFTVDTQTGDKNQAPLHWFKERFTNG
jgi:hypothetical protein